MNHPYHAYTLKRATSVFNSLASVSKRAISRYSSALPRCFHPTFARSFYVTRDFGTGKTLLVDRCRYVVYAAAGMHYLPRSTRYTRVQPAAVLPARNASQFAHFVCHHRESTLQLAGSRRFDCRVQRQQIGLFGDFFDLLRHTGDHARALDELVHRPRDLSDCFLDIPDLTVPIIVLALSMTCRTILAKPSINRLKAAVA